MKTTITQHERLQLAGLLTIAQQAAMKVVACEHAMADLVETEDRNYADHLSDAVWDTEFDIDKILTNMKIEVEK